MIKILKSNKGYTLIEALICVMIGTIAVASMGYSLANGFWMADENRSHLYSLNALRDEMETIRGLGYDAIVALGNSSAFTNAQLLKLTNGAGVRTVSSSFGNDIKKITLTITWTARSGRTLTQSLVTYVTRRGINRA